MTPATDASEPRYVFVGGLHRSGTTLLADLLADLPGVAGLVDTEVTENEGHWLHREYPSVESFGGPGRFAHHPDAHLVEGALPAPDQVRRRIEAAWQPFWSDPTAPIRIEKSPQHLIQSRLVQELFPGSGFVMVSRHPVTVALATRKWTSIGPVTAPRVLPKLPIGTLVRHWLTAWEHFAADRDRLERVEVVRFEDLFADPTGTFSTVQAAMGLSGTVDTSSLREPPRRYDEQWRRWKRSPAGRLGAREALASRPPRRPHLDAGAGAPPRRLGLRLRRRPGLTTPDLTTTRAERRPAPMAGPTRPGSDGRYIRWVSPPSSTKISPDA